jgi:hypothetical protein
MSRVSRHHGTLRHSSSSIVGLPHIDAPSHLICLFYFHSSFLWSPVCINFNPGCYHLFLPLCCCITAIIIHKPCLISPRSIHLLHLFPLCYVHFIYSYTLEFSYSLCIILAARGNNLLLLNASRLLLTPFLLTSLVAPFLSSLSYIVPRSS